jgi:hypothetical protein
MANPDYPPFRWRMGVHGSGGADNRSRIAVYELVVGEYANDGGSAVFVGDLKGGETSEFVVLVDMCYKFEYRVREHVWVQDGRRWSEDWGWEVEKRAIWVRPDWETHASMIPT